MITLDHKLTLAQVVQTLQAQLPMFTAEYGVQSLGVFGSYLHGTQTPTSDLDLLVEYREDTPHKTRRALERHLQNEFGDIDLLENQNLKQYAGRLIRRQVLWLQKDGVAQRIRLPNPDQYSKNGANMPEREYLDFIQDMLTSMANAIEFGKGLNSGELLKDRMRLAAIKYEIQTIGEAASKIPSEVRALYPEIPWGNILGMRNHIVHDYGNVKSDILWEVLNQDLPHDQFLVEDMFEAEKKRRNIDETK